MSQAARALGDVVVERLVWLTAEGRPDVPKWSNIRKHEVKPESDKRFSKCKSFVLSTARLSLPHPRLELLAAVEPTCVCTGSKTAGGIFYQPGPSPRPQFGDELPSSRVDPEQNNSHSYAYMVLKTTCQGVCARKTIRRATGNFIRHHEPPFRHVLPTREGRETPQKKTQVGKRGRK